MPGAGLEPARPYGQRILSPLRLPIPSLGQVPHLTVAAESILFIYRVLFAVHRNDLIYIPRQDNAVPPRYAYSSAEALAGLLYLQDIHPASFFGDIPSGLGLTSLRYACQDLFILKVLAV